ncbi:mitochondrial ribosomal subunit S27-domain-containing protein [Phyllosticta capitalensis]
MTVPRNRIVDLMRAQCKVFNNVFNPEGVRMGTSVLRQRLIGPSVAAYYPRKVGTYQDFKKLYAEWESIDIDEFEREEHVAGRKARGKGAPKKKRTAPDFKKGGKKK